MKRSHYICGLANLGHAIWNKPQLQKSQLAFAFYDSHSSYMIYGKNNIFEHYMMCISRDEQNA